MRELSEVSLINKRGRIVFASPQESVKLINTQGMRLFPNPKRAYYPEYDETVSPNTAKLDPEALEGDTLEVVIL
jgi:hypothetical protein